MRTIAHKPIDSLRELSSLAGDSAMGRLLKTGLGDDGMPGGAGTSSVVAATGGRASEESKTSKGLGSNDVRLLERWCILVSSNAVVHSGDLVVRMGALADDGKVGGAWSGALQGECTLVGM